MPRVTFFCRVGCLPTGCAIVEESGLDSLWLDHEESSQVVLEADRMLFSRKVP